MVLGLLRQNYSVDTVTSVRAFFLLLPSELRPFSLGYGSHRRATTHVACGSLERCKQRPSRPRRGSPIGSLSPALLTLPRLLGQRPGSDPIPAIPPVERARRREPRQRARGPHPVLRAQTTRAISPTSCPPSGQPARRADLPAERAKRSSHAPVYAPVCISQSGNGIGTDVPVFSAPK